MSTEWNINTDIYDIVDSIKNVQKRYIEDEDETTLSLGVFGFITDTEAKKIQTATIMAGQLGNEMFPTRSILTKNVLTHAAYNGITDFNATPATITVTICIKSTDIDKYIDNNDHFYIDSKCPIFIGDYEFHIDYDIKLTRKETASGGYGYSAQYVLEKDGVSIINRLSNISNPYLQQPFIINIGGETHVGIQCTIRQVTIEEIDDSMVTDSIIENKSYTFTFDNQMADFLVEVTDNGVTRNITPYMYGSTPATNVELYCWYLYVGDDTIRITFDSKSYVPGLNSKIYIKSFTTLGSAGNFEYLNIDNTSEGLYIIMDSDTYGYKNMTTYMVAVTDSVNGADRKSKEELQKLIPKASISRGSITTEKDLANYFDLINTDENRLVMQKKVDNMINRTWYGYFLLKDDYNNIIPTNSIKILLNINDTSMTKCTTDGRYILPAGTYIKYDATSKIGTVIDETLVPSVVEDDGKLYFDSGFYYYITMYSIVLDTDPLYCSYYLTTFYQKSYFTYEYVNEDNDNQFIANRFSFVRKLKTDADQYLLNFNIAKSINDSSFTATTTEQYEIQEEGMTTSKTITTDNIKVLLVVYKDGVPYRWNECTLTGADEINSIYSFEATIVTDNEYDNNNCIKIRGMNRVGYSLETYGYVPEHTEAKIFILVNDPTINPSEYPRENIDNIAPGYEDYLVTNIYKTVDYLDFFENYTDIINTKITKDTKYKYFVDNIPCCGAHYIMSDQESEFFAEAITEKKAYIDYCLDLVENQMTIDFKFFNTYGPSRTYALEDKTTLIGNIDVGLRFKVSLNDASDSNTVTEIKNAIKESIENLNDIGDLHAPNLITDITNEFKDRIKFIEFVGFNNFGADDQHIIKIDPGDSSIVPEFINVRNYYDVEENKWAPSIEIELV